MQFFCHEIGCFTRTLLLSSCILALPFSVSAVQDNVETTSDIALNKSRSAKVVGKGPLIIESQVKGSQEQPNVIYIMPWQGIEKPVVIEGNKPKVILPSFQPINPKEFKRQSMFFYNLNIQNKDKSK